MLTKTAPRTLNEAAFPQFRQATGIHPARKHEKLSYENLKLGNRVKDAWQSN